MLSAVFKAFEATEVQLTPKAITRLRVSAILSLFAIPLFSAAKLFEWPDGVSNVLISFCLLCMLAMLYAFSTRLINRLWVPEKYLDESEIERKRRSSSLTYQFMIYALMIILVLLTLSRHALVDFPWDTRTIFYLTAVLLFSVMSLQTIIAAFMISPISDDEARKVAADGRYKWLMAAMLIVFGGLGFVVSFLS